MPAAPVPDTEAEYAALVAAFADATIPFETWRHHQTHLLVALWYTALYPEPEALDRVRAGIQGILAANGIENTPTNGYHETITAVWIRLIFAFQADSYHGTFTDLARAVLREFGAQEVLFRYYSRDRIFSVEARAGWVEPDVQPLPRA